MNHLHQLLLCLFLFIGFPLKTSATDLLADRTFCGYQHTDDYTRPNDNISIDEFPWMVQLVDGKSQQTRCSGSLISNRYVLTAAHCLDPRYNNITTVKLGDYNVKTDKDCVDHHLYETECSDPVEQFLVEEKILHPFFNKMTKENDVALLRLSKSVIFSDYIRPICLPKKNSSELKVGEKLSTSGWGLLGTHLEQTDLKKRVMAVLVSKEECKGAYESKRRFITDDHLCASAMSVDSFTCNGDSGSPLMYSVKNQWEQVGIVSFSVGCGNGYPTVYGKVVNYLDWIEENVKK